MKTTKTLSVLFFALMAVALTFYSCSDDETDVPPPSAQANFTYDVEMITDPGTGDIHYEVSFTNSSLNAVGYHWDFGNGNESTEQNPVEVYTEDGVYEVVLTITPEQELHYNNLEKTERLTLVSTLFRESFEDTDLEENFPPEGWTLIDLDGDGHNWYWGSSMGDDEMEYYILSDSWHSSSGQALEPDNWIITPQVDLSEVSGAALEFQVTPRASGPQYRTEKYSVLISVTGTEVEDFVTIYSERLQEDMENWVWMLRTLDLSDYAGEKIHIAFRHHESTDLWSIVMRDFHVYITGK
ncbi:MAG: choice-of-anchor J domain-containing protein [Bacteroidales bacterium]|nr:choice-of-anchor J domain-containing protein [Bacteroidales bacterium]